MDNEKKERMKRKRPNSKYWFRSQKDIKML